MLDPDSNSETIITAKFGGGEGIPAHVPVRSHDPLKDHDGWIGEKFHLLEKLGEGGFGLVYRAEQTQPINRAVAVKILKAGMDTQQVIARFATERQSLALMEHPNIARVLDAGETERGLPFFVMELVRGCSITVYAKDHGFSIQERIELFIPVCLAVNHAHQKGIIHRDLKPSNVMVMDEDGLPVPKVIDFGIAKVLEQKDIRQTLATGMDQLVGTPGYISPEQIEFGSSHVDTRSDVYALGSILLELLSGRPLVTAMDVAQKPMHQILRDQVELDPPRPSLREPLLKGDLDWIILKALEKDPARRYRSADDLADDLKRYLKDEPVHATPPSRRYLIEKFVRRHRVGVAAGLAISLAVLAGGITSTALYFVSERNREEAALGRENLKKEFSRSDEQMARQLNERSDFSEAVAWLCRALRTDPENTLAATNLLSILEHEHLLHPTTPAMPLPAGAVEARLIALSRQAQRVIAVSSHHVSGSTERRDVLSLWNTGTFERTDLALPDGVLATALLVSKDGEVCFIARDDGQVMVWSLLNGGVSELKPAMQPVVGKSAQSVLCLALSGDGRTLMAGGDDGTLLAWPVDQLDTEGSKIQQTRADGAQVPITGLALDESGTLAATASNATTQVQNTTRGMIQVWDITRKQLLGESIHVDAGIGALALHRGREMVVIGLYSGVVHVLNYRELKEILPDLMHPSTVTSLTLNANASTLTVGDGGGYLHTWNLLNGKPRFPAQAHDGEIILAHESSEFGLVASVSRHGDLQVWNTLMNQRVQQRLQHSLAEVTITDDCSLLAMGPRKESSVQVWSIHQRMSTRRFTAPWDRELVEKPVFTKDSPEVFLKASALGWNPSLSLIACADADGHVQVHEAHSGKPRGITFQHSPAVGAVALSADGHLAATSGRDQEVRLWDGITGTSKGIVIRPGGFVSSLALSSDSQRLATVTDDGEIRVWETKQGNCLTPAIHAEQGINAILISEDGTHLFYRVPKSGWFSLPMPPLATHLPDWFLSLAESLARRRLSSEGKTVSLSLADLKLAVAAVPKHSREEDALALRWTRWLLADPYQRALSPIEGESFGDYLKSLQNEPAAAGEALRFLRNLP